MPIEVIRYKDKLYPAFQAEGFAAQYIHPMAKKVCKGVGLDIGCGKEEWVLKGAIPVDPNINGYDALNLPIDHSYYDYIFSSHCLEHLPNWVDVLDYWTMNLKIGGVLFLYLPHYTQEYWRSWNNRKHIHNLSSFLIRDYMDSKGYQKIFSSGCDLNHSFAIIGEKREVK